MAFNLHTGLILAAVVLFVLKALKYDRPDGAVDLWPLAWACLAASLLV